MNRSEAGKLGYKKTKDKIHKFFEEKKTRYEDNPVICNTCGSKLPYEKRKNKFCNHSCAAKRNNLGKAHNPKKQHVCKGCGQPVDLKGRWYCKKCSSQGKNKHLKAFEELKSARILKSILKKERGTECEICHLREWMGKEIPLILDHINGDSDNNSRENLRLVCGNCDMQLPTYKGRNRGKGRAYRRERYKQGKSY